MAFAVKNLSNQRICFFKQIPQQHPTARGIFPTYLNEYRQRESWGINLNF